MDTIKVIAAPGIKVPMEDKPRSYITDEEPADVEDSAYYQRRIADGDLAIYEPPTKKAGARAATVNATGE